jgi:predicted RNA binding protein YcfA (HicA-like mRNA interferase family)
MARIEKLIAAMRRNPRADWRIEQLKAIADRYGFAHRQQGTSHVTFRPPRGDKLTVPARRPIKPVYIRKFLALIDAQETTHGGQA